jgi:Domain of unknown function (DUF5916)/Carbohydrate family 9 binding domain-like
MKINISLSTLLFVCCGTVLLAQTTKNEPIIIAKKKYVTQKLTSPIKLDGKLDDKAWEAVAWGGDFIQRQPNEGKKPSQPTSFKILYDTKFLYIGYRCHDTAPDSIVKRMSRRDGFEGDWVEINIDSYHDQRTAFSFTVSASGVRGDELISDNGNNWETSWNPIWFAKTHIDDKGWTAEAKIPLSQLRFGKEPDKIWGFQMTRRFFRKEERSTWQEIPQSKGAWVSEFGELHGLSGVMPQKQVEIAPYTVAKVETYQPQPANPFATGTDRKMTFGADGKVAVTSDLMLDFTVNPDFGQVEADPSRIRIDGFQNFFQEQRPFFVESRNIFDYQLTGSEAGDSYDSDLLFYSRRIGGTPHGYPNIRKGEFAQIPQNTPILGAAKFSGKTKKGWSIGLLESVTQRVSATLDLEGQRREEVIEPLTNYFVGRIQKDFNEGQTVIGAIVTGVQRESSSTSNLNDQLHKAAYSGGVDFLHFWKKRAWYFRGNVVFSHVRGSQAKILATQMAFEHLFQRTNASEVSLDPTRTSLTGTGGTFRLGKTGGKQGKYGELLRFETGVTFRSPELEINDIGFMLTANEINHFTWAGLQWQRQIGIFRNARINYNHFSRWDFGGQFLYQAFNTNMHANFLNNWRIGTGSTWSPYNVSNTALRGGSSLRGPSTVNNWVYVSSDSRKKVRLNVQVFNRWGIGKTQRTTDYDLSLNAQPINAMTVSLGVGLSRHWQKQDQFVSFVKMQNEQRVIVSEVNQQSIRYTLRLNYNITPDLTLQYYGQPFTTRPIYTNFGYVTDPLNSSYDARFHRFTSKEIAFQNNRYEIDENRDGRVDYTFNNPNFQFVQFRSNLVARWEYKAGSELYLVWSQGNTPNIGNNLETDLHGSLFDNLFAGQARNIFLVKFMYRFLK